MSENWIRKALVFVVMGLFIGAGIVQGIDANEKIPSPNNGTNGKQKTALHEFVEDRYNTTSQLMEDNELNYCQELLNSSSKIFSPANGLFVNKLEENLVPMDFAPGEFIVKFEEGKTIHLSKNTDGIARVGLTSVDLLNEKYQVKSIENLFEYYRNTGDDNSHIKNIFKFTVPLESDIISIIHEYSLNPYVVYAEQNYIYHTCGVPNDPSFDFQWALNQSSDHDIDAPEAWDIESGDENIIIAMIDTGVDWDHPDLADNIWNNTNEILDGNDTDGNGFVDDIRGWDFYNGDSNPMDDNGHGTHCSGITCGVTNNSIGIAGVCWKSKVMPVKAFGQGGDASEDDLSNAITYAVDNGADVISMSWGSYSSSNLIRDALNYAYNNGVLCVAAAGNSASSSKFYPAGYDNVIAVAATDQNDVKASFSGYGSWIDVAAPGVEIYSTYLDDTYMYGTGTSSSCPHVAGLAGLLLSQHGFNQEEIMTIIRSSVDNVTSSKYIGLGRINAYDALVRNSTPVAKLNSSLDDVMVSGTININGTANGSTFSNYTVYCGKGVYPNTWMEIGNSSSPVNDSMLISWDTTLVDEGFYNIRLVVYDIDGFPSEDRATLIVNNICNTLYVGGSGQSNYTFIQEAIHYAGNGDTVFVYSGTYYENVIVDKPINLIGEDKNTTIIDGMHSGDVVYITADLVCIENFGIRNSSESWECGGIKISSSLNNITNCSCYNNSIGIHLYGSDENLIKHCNIYQNTDKGIWLRYSYNSIISSNIICENIYDGIFFSYSHHNNASLNIIYNSSKGVTCGSSTYNDIYENSLMNITYMTFYIDYHSDYNCICKNTLTDIIFGSVIWDYSRGNIVTQNELNNCKLQSSFWGVIDIGYDSPSNTVSDNIIHDANVAISLRSNSHGQVITGNTISNCSLGIKIKTCNSNSIIGNNINTYKDATGISLFNSNGNSFSYNIIGDESRYGINLEKSNNNILVYNEMVNCGLLIDGDSLPQYYNDVNTSNTVNNKPIYYYQDQAGIQVPSDAGEVILVNCSLCNVSGLMLNNSTVGIELAYSHNCTVSTNILDMNYYGIYQVHSGNNNVSHNVLSNNEYGVWLLHSSNNTLENNEMVNCGLLIDGDSLPQYYNDVNTSNTVNNKPIYYYQDQAGIQVPSDAGEVILVNCSLCNVSGLMLNNSTVGIELAFSNNSNISLNTIKNSRYGIWVVYSSNSVSQNTISTNDYGIHLFFGSSFNIISDNIMDNNTEGIYADWYCDDNNISRNVMRNNSKGVHLARECYSNIITGNTMRNNDKGIIFDQYNSNFNTISENKIRNNTQGIHLQHAEDNIISGNDISNNSLDGISFDWYAKYNLISENTINHNTNGILFKLSGYNTIIENNIGNNNFGIYLTRYIYSNNISHNNLVNNTQNGFSDFNNNWDNAYPSGGNYWDDFDEPSEGAYDNNSDGIADTPYSISGGGGDQDRYPLMSIYGPPHADFTYLIEGRNVSFNASLSYDYDGIIVNWTWDFGDGNTSYLQNPIHSYGDDGTYNVTITVRDDDEASDSTTKQVNVSNVAPTADFTYSPPSPTTADTITFTDNSSDVDGIIVNWTWNFDDGNISYLQNPTHSYGGDSTYNVSLTVMDDDGDTDSIWQLITVTNAGPTADFTWTPQDPTTEDVIQFLDNSSDRGVVNWTWDFNDSNISYLQNPTHNYSDNRDYNVCLTVEDDDGANDTVCKTVTVSNVGPIANFTWTPQDPTTEDVIQFLDNSSDRGVVNWTWDFDDGNISYEQDPTHQYSNPSMYTVCLTVKDDDNATDITCKIINVTSAVEIIDVNQSIFNRGFPIRHAIDGDWGAAQNFTPTLDTLTSVDIYLRKFGTPEFNLTVELREDHPQGTLIDTLTFTPGEVPSSWEWFEVDFSDITVSPGTDYFIVCPPAPSGVTTSFGYEWGYAFGNQYDGGSFWFTRDGGGLWRDLPTMYEFVFRTYGHD